MAAVRARRGQNLQLAGNNGAVEFDPHLPAKDLRMTAARHEELFRARVLDLHGTAGSQCQGAADVLEQHFLLAAEAAADARLDHVYALHRNLQDHGDLPSAVERHLRAAANYQAIVGVEPTNSDVRFDGAVLLAG